MSGGKALNIVKRIVRKPLLPGAAGRNVTVLDDDVFIVSYPKSGNTWTRFLIGNLFNRDTAVTFSNVERLVPDVYQNTNRVLLKAARPRLIKSHEYFDPRYNRVIFIVRDPRDVALSYYHYLIKERKIGDEFSITEFVERFVGGKWDPFGSWGANVGSWLGAREHGGGFLLLRYEDMLMDVERQLRNIASFLNIAADDSDIARAIQLSSFKHMSALESRESNEWVTTRSTRADKPFIRSGKAGGWKVDLPGSAVSLITSEWGSLMHKLDYKF